MESLPLIILASETTELVSPLKYPLLSYLTLNICLK